MPEFFTLVSPEEARRRILEHVQPLTDTESLDTRQAVGRTLAEALTSPQILPEFPRSTVDGYAVRAQDTFGAGESLPAYLKLIGEVPMGRAAEVSVGSGELALVHTGGMIPPGADAVVMVENTQKSGDAEVEVRRPAAPGENVIQPGEDIRPGDPILPAGHTLRVQDIGGLLAVGITQIKVVRRPRIHVFSTGDEVIPPDQTPSPGQVRDVNAATVSGLALSAGAEVVSGGILPDTFEALLAAGQAALAAGADMLVFSAGSSVSVRDMTADVFNKLGTPGVLVHGIATKPGKPTILGAAGRMALVGLPGNPVSAFVQFMTVAMPVIYRLLGATAPLRRSLRAKLTVNLASSAGREDYVPCQIVERDGETWAEPIFFKSNLIFSLVKADGLAVIPLDKTGLEAGEGVEVVLF